MNGGDGMQAQVDTRDNATVYSGSQFGFYQRLDRTKGQNQQRVTVRPVHELGEKPLRSIGKHHTSLQTQQDIFYYGSNRFAGV